MVIIISVVTHKFLFLTSWSEAGQIEYNLGCITLGTSLSNAVLSPFWVLFGSN